MSYSSISVREAIKNINNTQNGWFLPATQRPYVWGSRYENEVYICKLFDSLLRGYPIGGLVIWNTEERIPYKEFIPDYHQDREGAKIVEKGRFERKDKWLVYDGQQRLQTLYSCLYYTFNDKILVYDLLFKETEDTEPDETGFSFVEKNTDLLWNFVRLNTLVGKEHEEKVRFEEALLKNAGVLEDSDRYLVRENLEKLWETFVKINTKSLAYFPISSSIKEAEVNEIFERLNTGGIPLSLSDLLFSHIKEKYPFFEEHLSSASIDIYNKTDKGYLFSTYQILQVINLLVKGRTKVDPKKVKTSELELFNDTWKKLQKPLEAFFSDFIWGQFKINHSRIIPRDSCMFPIIVYLYEIYCKGFSFKNITKANLGIIKKFFIKAQINDWGLSSFVDSFTAIIREESRNKGGLFDFPIDKIEAKINENKKRPIDIHEESFVNYQWFALKILTPNRIYQFDPDMRGRFNPEIDHIFPIKLKGRKNDEDYEKGVDIIWNLQPTKGDINNYKTNYHPKLFFTDKAVDSDGQIVNGSTYIDYYDFLFPKKKTKIDFNDPVWDKPFEFINQRRKLMMNYLRDEYGIVLIEKADSD
jgi:uncharacterized protein with ParB-like and HNH nuclease domain